MPSAPVSQLYVAHLEQWSGLLELLSGGHSTRIYLQRGKVVQIEDMPGLLESVCPHPTGNLRDDLGIAIQSGVDMQEAFLVAAKDIGVAFALSHGSDRVEALFIPEIAPPPGCFPLSESLAKILRLGFAAERPPVAAYREYRSRLGWTLRPTGRAAKDLGTHLRDAVAGLSEDDLTWVALDLLLAVDVLRLEEVAEDPHKAERRRKIKAKIQALERRAQELLGAPPLEALGIDPKESMAWLDVDGVSKQYRKVATPFHPDQIGRRPAPYQTAASAVFSAMTEAKEKLTREPGRLKEEKERWECKARGVPFVSRLDRDEARACFKRAQGHEHYRNWQEALTELDQAIALDSGERLYSVMRAFVLTILKQRTVPDAIGDIREVCKDAGIIPRVEGLYRIGRLYKMADRPRDALASFENLLEIVPDHLGAKREVRLLRKRIQS
ncbi:MAG: tetratricopeptide (TPR) repeat protein [Cognaticolwellia sp.]|jgi:tetratricopeptide (TPR) repeat protein